MGCRTRWRGEIKSERLGKRASKRAVIFFACNVPGDLVQIRAQNEAFIKLCRLVDVAIERGENCGLAMLLET
jgi:hypothetical protein